jgi:hypothetical protein
MRIWSREVHGVHVISQELENKRRNVQSKCARYDQASLVNLEDVPIVVLDRTMIVRALWRQRIVGTTLLGARRSTERGSNVRLILRKLCASKLREVATHARPDHRSDGPHVPARRNFDMQIKACQLCAVPSCNRASPYANTEIKVNGDRRHQLILISRVNPVGRLCSRIAYSKGALHALYGCRSLSFGLEHI